MREEAARLQEEAERVQAALGEGEHALQRLVDARATVTEVLAEPPAAVAEPVRNAVAGRPGVFTALVAPPGRTQQDGTRPGGRS